MNHQVLVQSNGVCNGEYFIIPSKISVVFYTCLGCDKLPSIYKDDASLLLLGTPGGRKQILDEGKYEVKYDPASLCYDMDLIFDTKYEHAEVWLKTGVYFGDVKVPEVCASLQESRKGSWTHREKITLSKLVFGFDEFFVEPMVLHVFTPRKMSFVIYPEFDFLLLGNDEWWEENPLQNRSQRRKEPFLRNQMMLAAFTRKVITGEELENFLEWYWGKM